MKRNKFLVTGVLAVTLLLIPTGLWAQGEGDHREGNRCSRDHREKCLLGSFVADVKVTAPASQLGRTFKALLTFSPGGGVVETNTAQGQPVTVHGSWAASKEDHNRFDLTFITFGLQPMDWTTTPPKSLGPGGMAMTMERVTLSESGDSFTAVLVNQQMTPRGVFTVTANLTATRIFVVPLPAE